MSKDLKEKVLHTLGHLAHTENGKHVLASAGTATVAGLAAAAPLVPALVIAAAPAVLVGAAVWGIWALFEK